MFGPYRATPEPPLPEPRRVDEEVILAWALAIIGGLRITVAIVTRERWGGEATIAAAMALCGIRMLLRRRRP